ncbi:MAG: hypothetical protein M3041_18970 [Acidobacteriota bacterium]|nr:hypothetical protein [Acidobacteriota bacterium]
MRHALALLSALFVTSIASAQVNITGTWSGQFSITDHCDNGQTFTSNGNADAAFSQNGSSVTGSITVNNAVFTNGTTCAPQQPETVTVFVSGSVAGGSFSGFFTSPDGGSIPLSGSVSATSLSLAFPAMPTTSGSFTLSLISSMPPDSHLAGSYNGSYDRTVQARSNDPAHPGCVNLSGSASSSGPATTGVSQVGSSALLSLSISATKEYDDDGRGNCTLVTRDKSGTILGILNGNTFIAHERNERGVDITWTVVFSGNNLTGTMSRADGGEQLTFNGSKTSTGAPAIISSFVATPGTIATGDSSTLSWTTLNATSVSIDNGVGSQNASGSVIVAPKQTTVYTLTATGPNGTVRATATVTVAGAGPRVVVGTLPAGMVEATGTSGATDSFTLSNVGTAAASVTLTPSGNFFTISPSSFTIPAGGNQVVTITANTQQAGTYDGTISVSGGPTVPVHLLVAAPPTAPVLPQATVPRNDVALPAGQNPSGSVSFKNNGTGTLQGIAVSDVPWIIPQTGLITIAPGQTTQISFTIDRSKRPDSASLVGGLAGKISLVFLNSGSGKTALSGTPTGTVSVTIVDVVKPGVAPGSAPPLQSGEVALFIDGLRTANRFNGDLSMSSRNSVPDMKMFLTAGGNPTQVGTVPALASNVGVAFPAVIKNVFGITGLGGSLQVRSSQNATVALSAAVSTNVANPALASITALPILRSDRSIGPGERLVLAGVENSMTSGDAIGTSVWVQEVSGNAGHVAFEYRDGNGGVVGTDSGSVAAFTAAISDTPAGARSVIITNDSTSSARFAGYALVTADGSGDGWALVDPTRQFGSASGALIVPLVQPSTTSQTDLYVMNPSNSAVSVSIDINSGNRRHAVRLNSPVMPLASTVSPMSTLRTTISSTNGFVRINTAGSVSAAGRVTTSVGGTTLGSSLPAVPTSAAIDSGQSKRFTGVDDSSAKTVAVATPATYRSTLMLIETAGQSATVRVTLRYTFVAGALVSSQAVSSREFAMSPNAMLTIADLARSIIGPQRDSFGDLRNMQVDIDVIDGSGKVLSFMEAIDNASGDIAVRAE